MINLTRINNMPILLNSDLIEHVESTPDTVVRLTSGRDLMVRESPEEIIARVIEFRRRLHPEAAFHPDRTEIHGETN
ncbi:MAG: flagellar FlbD family protein [Bryobacteraceae bacterium]